MNRIKSVLQSPTIVLAIWVILLQLFCNIDSYLYAQIGQCDSACFFMCGKAMMNGMTPYVDFTDSKGVLLWLIYGIGYLIDHYSYVGVFWVTCVFIWGTLIISYQTARLYLEKKFALLASILLMLPLMYWNFYFETKSEHFCWPAVAWGIYVIMRGLDGRFLSRTDFVWLGVGFIACLMIKWSVALMMMCFVVSSLWIGWLSKQFKSSFLAFLLGILFAATPFVVYFSITGIWSDMWQEYFVNTLSSVSIPLSKTISVYCKEWMGMVTTKRFVYLLYIMPAFLWWRKTAWFSSLLPALCGIFFIALSIRHDNYGYYISIVGPFAIFAIIGGIKYFNKIIQSRIIQFLVILFPTLYVLWGNYIYKSFFCTKENTQFDQFMAISYTMSKIENPNVIVIGQERGVCMGTSMPGSKYWITQLGVTDEMWEKQLTDIYLGNADFIICNWIELSTPYICDFEKLGYKKLGSSYAGDVYTKHKLLLPNKVRHFSMMDILYKKTYMDMYK